MTYFILGIAIGIFGSIVLGFTIMYVHKIRPLHLEGGKESGTSCQLIEINYNFEGQEELLNTKKGSISKDQQ